MVIIISLYCELHPIVIEMADGLKIKGDNLILTYPTYVESIVKYLKSKDYDFISYKYIEKE